MVHIYEKVCKTENNKYGIREVLEEFLSTYFYPLFLKSSNKIDVLDAMKNYQRKISLWNEK